MLFDLKLEHLARVGFPENSYVGNTSMGSEGVSSIATGAITLAKQATDKVAEMAKIVNDLNTFKKETTANNVIVNGTFVKIANKLKGIIKDTTDSATTLSEMEVRLGKLESKTAKPRELTTKETESITRLLMPQIEQAVQKALAAAQTEFPPSTPSNITRRTHCCQPVMHLQKSLAVVV
ncbi:hypothetical protein BGZ61DRAFT_525609 [Ilyonectria robusta]|uniref:uncharacterized protein n=1 Tax=Ilyonectria robusta TaxID=1079257 RepID=UPI001E8E1A2B|nr:uncharacterized protein BGZ61DRAFT_525609 [Ilyonectria robusta]KAH8737492.1 hypothetical protein BGZ61DRAFT_525609 [Ilyonectria robusta]